MATLTDYKGLEVVEDATGDGGIALTDNFKELADRAPYQAAANPTASSDSNAGFAPGDQWLNTSTQVLWACISAGAGAAVWKSIFNRSGAELNLIPAETAEKVVVAGGLQVDGNVGIGTSSPQAKLHGTGSTILGIATSAVADANLGNSQLNVWLDETNSLLKLKSKTSAGVVRTAEIPAALTALNNITAGTASAGSAVVLDANKDITGIRNATLTGALILSSAATNGLEIYNTADQVTNYEKLSIRFASNVAQISSLNGGTGTNRSVSISGGGGTNVTLSSTGCAITRENTTAAAVCTINGGTPGLVATSGTQSALLLNPIIKQTGTAGYTGLIINPTEGTTGSGAKLLQDWQVGGASKAVLDNAGNVRTGGYLRIGGVSDPISTVAGDLTCARFNIGNIRSLNNGCVLAAYAPQPATSGTIASFNYETSVSPTSDSTAEYRNFSMSLGIDTTHNINTALPSSISGLYCETRPYNCGSISNLSAVRVYGMIAGSASATLGNVTQVSAISCLPITSFANTLTSTITRAIGVSVDNSVNVGSGPLTITGQAGVLVAPLTTGTNNSAIVIGQTTIPTGDYAIYSASANASYLSGNLQFKDAANLVAGTSTGMKIGTATNQKLGFWNATPVVQPVLATGAGATVDNVITFLQNLGLCRQS